MWAGGRVVECAGLEHRYRRESIEGSNPSLSANSYECVAPCKLGVHILIHGHGLQKNGSYFS